ncbi:MAG: ABC transporter six-transmembrane domain-containing protein [Saprospiraceae bacterium]
MFKSREIYKLIWSHKQRLALTYLLFSLEMAGTLGRPFFIGKAINDLIDHSYHWLFILIIVHFIWMIIGFFRHKLDTRTYSQIYNDIILKFVTGKNKNDDVSKKSALSSLTKDMIDFLEYDVYFVIEAGYNIIGSLIFLIIYQSAIVWLCLGVMLPVALLSMWYGRKMRQLQKLKNDELEAQVNVLSNGNSRELYSHFSKLRKWQIKISDHEAVNFGLMELIVISVITASLLLSTNTSGASIQAGDLIGIYFYILKFLTGLDTVPYALQRWSNISDIIQRLEPSRDEPICPLPHRVNPTIATKSIAA